MEAKSGPRPAYGSSADPWMTMDDLIAEMDGGNTYANVIPANIPVEKSEADLLIIMKRAAHE